MSWLLLLVLLLICQFILILWRPKGWQQLLLGLLSVQWITACLVSAVVLPMIGSAMLTTWDEWQSRKSKLNDATTGASTSHPTGVLPYRMGEGGVLSTPYLHGPVAAWQGIDYSRPCGTELVAPADMIVEGVSADDGQGNTSIKLRFVDNPGLSLGLVHGRYLAQVGEYLSRGDRIGYTDSIGTSTGCHDHIVLWRDAVPISVVEFTDIYGGRDKPLIMSRYDPHLGGVNCEEPCTVTASGELVDDWWGAGAACVRSWLGRTIEIDGHKWRCIDTGGKIVETTDGYWVDLLTKESPYSYGQIVSNWRFVD